MDLFFLLLYTVHGSYFSYTVSNTSTGIYLKKDELMKIREVK